MSEQAKKKTTKKRKNQTPESQFRFSLDSCTKRGDLFGALALYEGAVADKLHLSPYHFNTLLHVVSASIESLDGDAKQSTVNSGFRIFDRMVASGAAPTEATITSMARIAAQRSDSSGAEFAFDLVKSMAEKYGAVPRLRTYGPALFAFCQRGDAEMAYAVEDHMVSRGVVAEEPEIAALLEVSSKGRRGMKVYEYLQNLRGSVRCVAPSTADILVEWFGSEAARHVRKEDWDMDQVKDKILVNGGGWHGVGWLGNGEWEVGQANVSSEGQCSCCQWQLASVDIDRIETEKFAESVASLALERETKSNFKNFQEWLKNHTEYEAIVDGANIGFYQQNFAEGGFNMSQLDTVVRELYKRSQSKWPLVILHNKRVHGLMENPSNQKLLETWRKNGALYTTPTGSNDDWYWLYAAINLKCLLVSNDEMRDHIFELLGRNFFPEWKERHQVKYTFIKGDLRLLMPPPYSSVIQESELGSWHVPIDEKCGDERQRKWLCITRPGSHARLSEADLAANATKTPADLHKTPVNPVEGVNAVQKISSEKARPTNGKRKHRSPSPSEQLID